MGAIANLQQWSCGSMDARFRKVELWRRRMQVLVPSASGATFIYGAATGDISDAGVLLLAVMTWQLWPNKFNHIATLATSIIRAWRSSGQPPPLRLDDLEKRQLPRTSRMTRAREARLRHPGEHTSDDEVA